MHWLPDTTSVVYVNACDLTYFKVTSYVHFPNSYIGGPNGGDSIQFYDAKV